MDAYINLKEFEVVTLSVTPCLAPRDLVVSLIKRSKFDLKRSNMFVRFCGIFYLRGKKTHGEKMD